MHTFDIEVKPGPIVTNVCVRQSISAHVASKVIRVAVRLDAARQIARIELA